MRFDLTQQPDSKKFTTDSESLIKDVGVTTTPYGTQVTLMMPESLLEEICNLLQKEEIHYHCLVEATLAKVLVPLKLPNKNTIVQVIHLLKEHDYLAEDLATRICQNYPDGYGNTKNITDMEPLSFKAPPNSLSLSFALLENSVIVGPRLTPRGQYCRPSVQIESSTQHNNRHESDIAVNKP